MNSRTVKRFTESSITGSSFYSKDVAVISAHLMDSHHKQLYLRLLKSKKVTNGSNSLANRKLKSSNIRPELTLSQNSSFNCPNSCNKEISRTMMKQQVYGGTIDNSSCGYYDHRSGITSTSYPIDDLSCDKFAMASLSVKNLWGREVVDDFSQCTYLGHYSKKVALSTVPSEHDDKF
jgi:transcription elongation factor Elf1